MYGDSHLSIRSAIRSDFVAAILPNSFSIACNCDETWSANLLALPATGRPIPFFLTTEHNEHTETNPSHGFVLLPCVPCIPWFPGLHVFRGSQVLGDK